MAAIPVCSEGQKQKEIIAQDRFLSVRHANVQPHLTNGRKLEQVGESAKCENVFKPKTSCDQHCDLLYVWILPE